MEKTTFALCLVLFITGCASQNPAKSPTPPTPPVALSTSTSIPPTITPGPTPTPWLDMTSAQAAPLCTKAEHLQGMDQPPVDQRPVPGGYFIMRYQQSAPNSDWSYYALPSVQAETPQDIHSLVCISEFFWENGKYDDGTTAYSLTWTIYIVSWPNGELLYTDQITEDPPFVKFVTGDGYAEEPKDKLAGLLDTASKNIIAKGIAEAIALSPDNSKLVSNNFLDGTLDLWDTKTGQKIWSSNAKNPLKLTSTSPIFTLDGKYIVVGTLDGEIRWYDAENGNELRSDKGDGEIQGLSVSPDGTLLASSEPNQITIWDVASGSRKLTLDTGYQSNNIFGENDSFDTSFSADSSMLAARASNTIDIWDISTKAILHQIPVTDGYAAGAGYRGCVQFLPEGKFLAICDLDEMLMPVIKFWDTTTWQEDTAKKMAFPDSTDLHVASSRDQKWLIVKDSYKVLVIDPNTLKTHHTFQASNYVINGVALTSDNKTLWVDYPQLGVIPYDIP